VQINDNATNTLTNRDPPPLRDIRRHLARETIESPRKRVIELDDYEAAQSMCESIGDARIMIEDVRGCREEEQHGLDYIELPP